MSRRSSLGGCPFRPRLEGRVAPAVFTVTSATDDPLGSNTLRVAIGLANRPPGADEIRVALPAGSTITVNRRPAAGRGPPRGRCRPSPTG